MASRFSVSLVAKVISLKIPDLISHCVLIQQYLYFGSALISNIPFFFIIIIVKASCGGSAGHTTLILLPPPPPPPPSSYQAA